MDTLAWLQVNFDADEVRTLIAEYLDIDAKRVTDEMHLSDDLGLDWLDKLELMILIEDKFADVEFSDAAAQEIEVVGDLIRQIEMSNKTPSVKNHQNVASTFFRSAA
jgi:acyl carrier protein